jgi:hypothetical protein
MEVRMRKIAILVILLSCYSCLKKIEEVETANTNIFDPDYGGEKWWVYDDVFVWTNSNNDQFIRFEFSVLESFAPDLKPISIALGVSVNGSVPIVSSVSKTTSGDYKGTLDINPIAATNFCLDIGVYVEEEQITINSFSDCMSL